MDLAYEQSEDIEKKEPTVKTEDKEQTGDFNAEINKKTEESFEKLETEIAKTYDAIESKATTWKSSIGSLWNNFKVDDVVNQTKKQVESLNLNEKINETKTKLTKNIDELQKKLVTEDKAAAITQLSKTTNNYLDELDKELEQVENYAGLYFNKFSNFIKESVSVEVPDDAEDDVLDENEAGLLFNVGADKSSLSVPSNRTEAQLHSLRTNPNIYLSNKNHENDPNFKKFKEAFDIDSKTEEISKLLSQHKDLNKLSTALVPTKIEYKEFWCHYFFAFEKIHEEELNRKKLLSKNTEESSHELGWGDDDDDDNEQVKTLKNENKQQQSTETITKKEKVTEDGEGEEHEEEEDDDDDDWE